MTNTAETIEVTAADVRAWARDKGFEVGSRGHLPESVIGAYNRRHRRRKFSNRNPFAAAG